MNVVSLTILICISVIFVVIILSVVIVKRNNKPLQQHENILYPVNIIHPDTTIKHLQDKNLEKKETKFQAYIHVCMIGTWSDVLKNQLSKLRNSGLLNQLETCHIIAVGTNSNLKLLHVLINKFGPKCRLRLHSTDTTQYERTTLRLIWKDSQHNTKINYYILYLHSKGVTKSEPHTYKCVQDWSNYMCYYLITQYKLAIEVLKLADICGVNLTYVPQLHFSGNFWWANANYIRTLPYTIGSDYHDTEMWLGLMHPTAISLSQSNIQHYHLRYPQHMYQDNLTVLNSNKENLEFTLNKFNT